MHGGRTVAAVNTRTLQWKAAVLLANLRKVCTKLCVCWTECRVTAHWRSSLGLRLLQPRLVPPAAGW